MAVRHQPQQLFSPVKRKFKFHKGVCEHFWGLNCYSAYTALNLLYIKLLLSLITEKADWHTPIGLQKPYSLNSHASITNPISK